MPVVEDADADTAGSAAVRVYDRADDVAAKCAVRVGPAVVQLGVPVVVIRREGIALPVVYKCGESRRVARSVEAGGCGVDIAVVVVINRIVAAIRMVDHSAAYVVAGCVEYIATI